MIEVVAKVKGPLFTKKISPVVQTAIISEAIDKVDERMGRSARARSSKGRKLIGNARNTVTTARAGMMLNVRSTAIRPRVTGKSWTFKNIGIIKAMVPNVMRSVAKRIVGELGG